VLGWQFKKYIPDNNSNSPFENLLKIFKELLIHTSGDVSEALSWLTELDKQYQLTNNDYGISDFIQELKDKGYLSEQKSAKVPQLNPTNKMEMSLRRHALDDIFDQLKKSKPGKHNIRQTGKGDEHKMLKSIMALMILC